MSGNGKGRDGKAVLMNVVGSSNSKPKYFEEENQPLVVLTGNINIAGKKYLVMLIKSPKVFQGGFVVVKVMVDGKEVWNFRDEGFEGIAILIMIKGKHFICLRSKRRQIEKIVPLEDIENSMTEKYSRVDSALKNSAENSYKAQLNANKALR